MLDIIQDVNEAVEMLEKRRLRYALVGGVAVGLHGGERSTFDVDFLLHPDDVEPAVAGMKRRGYIETAQPLIFKTTGLTLRRVWRIRPGRDEASVVDFLSTLEERYLAMIDAADRMPWARGKVSVIRKEDLLAMKSSTGRYKDLGDVETLKAKMQEEAGSGSDPG